MKFDEVPTTAPGEEDDFYIINNLHILCYLTQYLSLEAVGDIQPQVEFGWRRDALFFFQLQSNTSSQEAIGPPQLLFIVLRHRHHRILGNQHFILFIFDLLCGSRKELQSPRALKTNQGITASYMLNDRPTINFDQNEIRRGGCGLEEQNEKISSKMGYYLLTTCTIYPIQIFHRATALYT